MLLFPASTGCLQECLQRPVAPQQPTILQQLPAASPPAVSVRRGHIKEDLVELMMIQNAQMHQVIMNNMTMTALSSFGYSHPSSAPEATRHPVIVHEEEEDPMVYHHHYQPAPYLPYPAWAPPVQLPPSLVYQTPLEPLEPATAPPSQHRNSFTQEKSAVFGAAVKTLYGQARKGGLGQEGWGLWLEWGDLGQDLFMAYF
ncbi:proline-rich protein 29-like isoform X2 [Osmerus eperlanus]|uniref:proline-rich protein 29-like isoform X2 n=1 Tax=Osmerus eperlanus TaxID=29151 RepID=UPI002E14E221